jgi:L-rhamnose mutarotase
LNPGDWTNGTSVAWILIYLFSEPLVANGLRGRHQDLFLVMQVDDFDAAWSALDNDPTNLKWQHEMAALFEPVPGLKPDEKFAMMKEVFYLD